MKTFMILYGFQRCCLFWSVCMLNIFFHWMFCFNKQLEKEKDVDGFDLANFSAPASSNWKKTIRQLPARHCVLVIAARGVPSGFFLVRRTKINKQIQLDAPPAQQSPPGLWTFLVKCVVPFGRESLYICHCYWGVNPKHPMLRGWNTKTSPLNPVLCWGFHNPYEPITISKRLRARDCMSQLPLGFRPRSTGEPLEDLR